MIRRAWDFLSNPKNLAVLSLLGAALAFLWKVAEPRWFAVPPATQASATRAPIPPVRTPAPTSKLDTPATQHAEVRDGGAAINAGDNATITITR